jgi:hypothetical protein
LLWYHENKEPLSGEHKNQNTDKTHCIRGHEFTAENTYMKGEHRICIICRNEAAKIASRIRDAEYRALRKSDPIKYEAVRRRKRSYQLRRVGWTIDLFEETLAAQDGCCAVCKIPLDLSAKKNGAGDQACADHEHINPPKPRGVLCGNCNLGIGNLKENPEIMQAAIAYVEKWKG